ncbi:MAG: sigma-54-dependent Fis family transcriptional regulator [Candidatus Competibacteraceae bacterium]|nr:sigma-54-dependent Fis family transcriptional regulator [Candidatus Competibacteraceae bacterium]
MDGYNALIVDDEADIRELIEMTLLTMQVRCFPAETLQRAETLLKQHEFSFCITDMRLPDGNGLDLIAHIQKRHPNLPVAVITAHGNVESAVEALKLGAFDFVSKPFELSVLRSLVNTALKIARPTSPNSEPQVVLHGHSTAMDTVRTLIHKLARSQAPVVITGESGTGKELAARLVHASGPRADKSFVPVNCGAIPENLMESEFFGYKKGSFTGATQDKAGLFQAAHGGTLFLDEVADLPQHMQVKLLRAIQERAVRPVGAPAEVPVDVRILSATHKDLGQLIETGAFRQDLYYRLNVIELRMPSLRERPVDIAELAGHILERLGQEHGLPAVELAPEALKALQHYAFPGNIRELENILERAFTLCEGQTIASNDLLLPDSPAPSAPHASTSSQPTASIPDEDDRPSQRPGNTDLESYLEKLERKAIMKALEATRYNKTAAAEKLGISFRALRYRLKKLGLD